MVQRPNDTFPQRCHQHRCIRDHTLPGPSPSLVEASCQSVAVVDNRQDRRRTCRRRALTAAKCKNRAGRMAAQGRRAAGWSGLRRPVHDLAAGGNPRGNQGSTRPRARRGDRPKLAEPPGCRSRRRPQHVRGQACAGTRWSRSRRCAACVCAMKVLPTTCLARAGPRGRPARARAPANEPGFAIMPGTVNPPQQSIGHVLPCK